MEGRSSRCVRVASLAGLIGGILSPQLHLDGQPSPIRQDTIVAIVHATVIDGNGGLAAPNATVVVSRDRIVAVGEDRRIRVAARTHVIDATGRFLVPGFIDTNVHLSTYSPYEMMARYQPRFRDIIIENAQSYLRHGITTVRDSYGVLQPLLAARDTIARGALPGPSIYVAGNIIGWGADGSFSLQGAESADLSVLDEQMQDAITQGVGEELMNLEPDSLRVMINRYLDKGVDFVKYGGTSHSFFPAMITFSPRAQAVIVEETHKRHRVVDTHATSPEGLRLAVLAGVDVIQHPELLDAPMSADLTNLIVSHGVVCSMMPNQITGEAWTSYLAQRRVTNGSAGTQVNRLGATSRVLGVQTGREQRREERTHLLEHQRENAERLIHAGCIISVASDGGGCSPAEYLRAPPPPTDDGVRTANAIEGLVELGMTPLQAIVAATRNGAIASHALTEYGTVEQGKLADLLLLDADPRVDIHNVEKVSMVMKAGQIVDIAHLPTNPIFCGRPPRHQLHTDGRSAGSSRRPSS